MNTFFLATRANKSGDGHASEHASAGAAGAPAAVAAPSAAGASPLRPRRAITLADLRARLRVSEDPAAPQPHRTETPAGVGGGNGLVSPVTIAGRGGPSAATGGPSATHGVAATAPSGPVVSASHDSGPQRGDPGGPSAAAKGRIGDSPPLYLRRKSSVSGAGPPEQDSAPETSE